MKQKNLGVFRGLLGVSQMSTVDSTHIERFSISKAEFPLQSQRLQVFRMSMGTLPEDLACPAKAVCASFVPLPPLGGHTAQGNPKASGGKGLSSITATSLFQPARDRHCAVPAFAAGTLVVWFPSAFSK